MMTHLRYLVLVLAASLVVGAIVVYRWPREPDLTDLTQRVDRLDAELAEARGAPGAAVAYLPHIAGNITDIRTPAVEILKQLPGVANVDQLVTCDRPARRIIHIADWRYVASDQYLPALAKSLGCRFSAAEEGLRYRELLVQVELVLIEQCALLRCLVAHHGLKSVFADGLTPEGLLPFHKRIASLRDQGQALAQLHRHRANMQGNVEGVDKQLSSFGRGHQQMLMPFGSPGQLALEQTAEVLPLDDEGTLPSAKPVRPDGTNDVVDLAGLDARHDFQVKAALTSGPVAVLVLGASHDLSASVRKHGADVEYIRVITQHVSRFAK